jgi:hypothetical protein
MTLPKKGTRKITVDGKQYLWRLGKNQRCTVVICDPRTEEIDTVNLPMDEESHLYHDNYSDECTDPITPLDAEAAVRLAFLNQKIPLPTAHQRRLRHQKKNRRLRHQKKNPKPKRLVLDIEKATIVQKETGEDEVLFHVANAKSILQAAVGQRRAEEVYGNEFTLNARVTHGQGADLLRALGFDGIETVVVKG